MVKDKILDLFKALFENMWGWIYAPFKGDLDSLNTLIYKNEDKYYGIFNEDQFGVVAQGMAIMQSLAIAIILISIVIAGMRISSAGINPSNRSTVIEYFKDFLIVGLLFFNLSTLFELIFSTNSMFVNAFSSAKQMLDGGTLDKVSTFMDKGVLGGLIIGLILLGLWIWANFFYMMRTLTLMLLMIISPVAVALYLVPQTKGITIGVLKEFTGTVLVQSIHAFTYWVITAVAKDDFGLGSVILYIIFIPITESIRSLIGLGGQMNNNLNRAAAMMGGSALMGVSAAVKGALNGDTVSSLVRKGIGGAIQKTSGNKNGDTESDESKGILAGAGTDIGTTSRAERMLRSGEITSKMGKAAFGMAGAIAGSPMGPQGSMVLGSMGFAGGGVAGGLAGRMGMAGAEGIANRAMVGGKAMADKVKGVWNGEKLADEKLADVLADRDANAWATENKESFMKGLKERFPDADDHSVNKLWDKELLGKKSEFLDKARSNLGTLKSTSGKVARASDLMNSTVNSLTNDWAKNNKDAFMKDYDATNSIPANATEEDIQKHYSNRNNAWEQAVKNKKGAIGAIASNAIEKFGVGPFSSKSGIADSQLVNKDAFVNEVGTQLSSVIGKGAREGKLAVSNATKDVQNSSLYSGNAVNTDFVASQLAHMKTNQSKKSYIQKATSNGVSSSQAEKDWETKGAPETFAKEYSTLTTKAPSEGGLPRSIPLDHRLLGQNPIVRGLGGVGAGIVSGAVSASGIVPTAKFIADTKLAAGATGLVLGTKEAWSNRNPQVSGVTSVLNSIGSGGKAAASYYKAHTPENVVGKQANFRNAHAYISGIAGGVKGYKHGATSRTPYDNLVNNAIREISEIEQLAQTVGPKGQEQIAPGAIRMVTTRGQSVIQVRDKTGNLQTVSRIASGDSSLRKDETIYQDLSIQNGLLTQASDVYKEDSGGGKITLNRTINVNPNKIVANRNTAKTPRVIQEVQSYNQLVDSGQYTQKHAIAEMSDIRMVVDRNRSYLVGKKDGSDYRISPYGRGDARLTVNDVIERPCEIVKNDKLVVSQTDDYTSSMKVEDIYDVSNLLPRTKTNSRTNNRKLNEKLRNKSFTESLKG